MPVLLSRGLLTARAGLMQRPPGPQEQQDESSLPAPQQGTQIEDQESSCKAPEQVLHWSGSGPEQEPQEEWQGRQEEDEGER